ncbi:hypothetical protein [Sulfuriferula nivalis]|uniref:Uncharacterized protein n=1 Tax=Sulfuriferula nivalis TaxID=2675298 RepID=A0A809RZF1_9PROT|nr:hypothetical protein [Sulfuriferula nivalis]BBO99597.1 hypothetical protein SFSGTM_03060 [Sulfuriferula nivalis]
MNKTLTKIFALALFASFTAPALADGHGDHDGRDGYRGYDAPHYYQDHGRGDDRGDRNWDHGHGHGYEHGHGRDYDTYYAQPYYQPPRVIYAPPPPVAYYPAPAYRSGVEVRLLQLF